jgi:hypothetical protein
MRPLNQAAYALGILPAQWPSPVTPATSVRDAQAARQLFIHDDHCDVRFAPVCGTVSDEKSDMSEDAYFTVEGQRKALENELGAYEREAMIPLGILGEGGQLAGRIKIAGEWQDHILFQSLNEDV